MGRISVALPRRERYLQVKARLMRENRLILPCLEPSLLRRVRVRICPQLRVAPNPRARAEYTTASALRKDALADGLYELAA